jgi:hypothetical protein
MMIVAGRATNEAVRSTIGNVGNALSCRVTTVDLLGGKIEGEYGY